jgi:hypothetical protein
MIGGLLDAFFCTSLAVNTLLLYWHFSRSSSFSMQFQVAFADLSE